MNGTTTPSIGSIGLTVDGNNQRVKILHNKVFSSADEVKACLTEDIAGIPDARKLLASPTSRFTARVIGKGVLPLGSFSLTDGFRVTEEARIRTSSGLDIIYVGGNAKGRVNEAGLATERKLALENIFRRERILLPPDISGVSFERLTYPVSKTDAGQLIDMYRLCFTSYLVPLDEALVQGAAKGSIFFIARDGEGRIIASAIGESLRVGPVTLFEISEEASHPKLRVRGAASGCARKVIEEGKRVLETPIVPFWEARMWRNILGMGQMVGLTEYVGILHQHCKISSPPEFTSLPQTEFGSLAVFHAP